MDQSGSIRGGSPGGPGRRVGGPGWRTIVRWGSWPLIVCLLASLGAGVASADSAPPGSAGAGAATASGSSYTTGAWSGYVAQGGSYQAVNAIFTVPTGSCTQGPSESMPYTAYWAGLQGPTDFFQYWIVQAGFSVSCQGGHAVYGAWTANTFGMPTPVTEPVAPGDQLAVSVFCLGNGSCTLELQDITQNWDNNITISTPAGFSALLAAVAGESHNGGINSTPVQVIDANVDTTPIGQVGAQANLQNPSLYGGTAVLVPSALDPTGMNFQFAWDGNPGS
jgi:hypothetical protein